jgi:hypothetical protein
VKTTPAPGTTCDKCKATPAASSYLFGLYKSASKPTRSWGGLLATVASRAAGPLGGAVGGALVGAAIGAADARRGGKVPFEPDLDCTWVDHNHFKHTFHGVRICTLSLCASCENEKKGFLGGTKLKQSDFEASKDYGVFIKTHPLFLRSEIVGDLCPVSDRRSEPKPEVAPPASPAQSSTELALYDLKALHEKQLISDAEYETKRAEILKRL